MGMYDYLNEEQIKFFHIPLIGMPDRLLKMNTCLSYMGGNLRGFNEGKEVPWKTFYYNLGKDFNIIDFEPFDHDKPMVHMIRNGKNAGFVYLDEAEEIFNVPNYEENRNLLSVKTKQEALDFVKARKESLEAFKNRNQTASTKWFNYIIDHKDEGDTDEFKKTVDELQKAMDEEREINAKHMKPFRKKAESFIVSDTEESCEKFGSLLDALRDRGISIMHSLANDDFRFVVQDDRLIFITAYNEFMEMCSDEFVQKYFKALNMNKRDRRKFRRWIKEVHEIYKILINWKFTKEMFNENYALKDIHNGRYKDYYLKFNIVPYEGFDYSLWQ